MARVRLTNKTRIANDPSDMEGLRQDCGKKTRKDKYTNFDPAKDDVGGRGKAETDGSKLYENDQKLRNEMHVTELKLKQAKMWERSKLATKLAMYLLGEKAPKAMVKAQAAQFLSLGNAKLAKAVSRFAKTEYLYAQEQEQEVAESAAEETVEQEVAEPAAEETVEQEVAEPAAEETVEQEAEASAVAQEQQQEVTQACGDVSASCECGEGETCEKCTKSAEDEIVEQAQEEEVQQAGEDDLDDEVLAALFESNSNNLVAKKEVKSSGKVGVQKFEQPQQRVASNKLNLDQLWEGAPDLSNIF